MSFSPAHIAPKILKGSCLHNLLVHTTQHISSCLMNGKRLEIKNFKYILGMCAKADYNSDIASRASREFCNDWKIFQMF